MVQSRSWPQEVDAFYGAVGDEAAMYRALDGLRKRLDARSLLMGAVPASRHDPCRDLVSIGVPPEAMIEYRNHFHLHDSWLRGARAKGLVRPGAVATSDEMVDRRELQRSYFWRAFLSRYDHTEALLAVLDARDEGDELAFVVFHRGELQPRFASKDRDLLVNWLPDLRNALRLHRRLAPRFATGKALEQLFGEAASPMAMLDALGRVTRHNPAWEAWAARPGAQVRIDARGQLAVRERSAWRGVAPLIRPMLHELSRPGVLRLRVGADRQLTLRRIEHGPLSAVGPGVDRVIGIVETVAGGHPESLRERFGLTPAQARVALSLADGKAPSEAAAALGISLSTVRTHITALYAKTGCKRLPSLVATLSGAKG